MQTIEIKSRTINGKRIIEPANAVAATIISMLERPMKESDLRYLTSLGFAIVDHGEPENE